MGLFGLWGSKESNTQPARSSMPNSMMPSVTSSPGTVAAAAAASPAGLSSDAQPAAKKKICCSCPETKGLRDVCIAERGEDHPYCQALIEAHKACLRVEGFNV